jgi:hypothetical protein
MLFLLVTIGVLSLLVGERTPAGGGFGWDGTIYRELTINPLTKNPTISLYSARRLLPSLIVRFALTSMGVPLNDANILRAFEILNLCLYVVSLLLFFGVSSHLDIRGLSLWLGFIGLFVNFGMLKFNFYLPVTTDTTGFALGIALLYCYLKKHRNALLLLGLLGAFAWPPILYQGLILYLLSEAQLDTKPAPGRAGTLVALAISLVITATLSYFLLIQKLRSPDIPILEATLILSLSCVAAQVFFGLVPLVSSQKLLQPLRLVRSMIGVGLLPPIFLCVVVREALGYLRTVNVGGEGPTLWYWITRNYAVSSVAQPLIGIVAHVVFFGPLIVVACISWRGVCRAARECGLGVVVVLVLAVILSPGSESRQLISLFPFVALLTVKAVEGIVSSKTHLAVFGVAAFLFSKVWMRINVGPMGGDYRAFPAQLLFMNLGPFMSNSMYVAHLAAVAVTGYVFYVCLLQRRAPSGRVLTRAAAPEAVRSKRFGKPFLYVLCLIVAVLVILAVWRIVARGEAGIPLNEMTFSALYPVQNDGVVCMTVSGSVETRRYLVGGGSRRFLWRATGTPAAGEPARLRATVFRYGPADSKSVIKQVTFDLASDMRQYQVEFSVDKESQVSLELSFLNDFYRPETGEDRNAYVRDLRRSWK